MKKRKHSIEHRRRRRNAKKRTARRVKLKAWRRESERSEALIQEAITCEPGQELVVEDLDLSFWK